MIHLWVLDEQTPYPSPVGTTETARLAFSRPYGTWGGWYALVIPAVNYWAIFSCPDGQGTPSTVSGSGTNLLSRYRYMMVALKSGLYVRPGGCQFA